MKKIVILFFALVTCNAVNSAPNYSYTTNSNSNNTSGYYSATQSNSVSNQQNQTFYQEERASTQDYYVDPDALATAMRYEAIRNGSLGSPETYLNIAKARYQANIANQAGMPYEAYICNGDPVCMQRMFMHQQYIESINNHANALQNQKIQIDANVNHYGSIDLKGY